ncbi:peptidoglycan DD-metalloendopeptidase family protein [Dyella sp. ASV21]|uniref:peptidoglycan DD-metalloendopeptidase family protein n=1 Tax=Dyella sp. ASV21 TaxID=2795114 RepID=UPI0018EAD8E8|nr:peptidoglycan DD-metalloendopeptidase family protein [Dyella sp. ASV21]
MLAAMNGYLRSLVLVSATVVLAACGTQRSVVVEPAAGGSSRGGVVSPAARPAPGGSYRVVKGDTLYSIAFRNGVDFRDLANWNHIDSPYTIWPGQELKLGPAGGKPAVTPVRNMTGTVVTTAKPVTPTPAPAATHGVADAPAPVVSVPVASSSTTPASTPASAASTAQVVPVAGAPVAAATTPPPPPPAPAAPGATRSSGGVAWRWPADGSLIKRFQAGDAIPGIEIAGKSGDPVRAAADGVVVYSGNGLVGYGELVIVKHNDSYLSAYGHNSKRLVKEGQRVSAGQQIAEMGATGATRDELQFQIRKDGNPVDPLGYLPSR